MATKDTLSALNSLADQVPGLNQKALKQVQAARDINMQRQVGAMSGKAPPQAAQQLATQQAMQAGQDIIAQRQHASQQVGQIKQAAIQEQSRVSGVALQEKKMAQAARLQEQEILQRNQLKSEELQSRKTILGEDIQSAARMQDYGIYVDSDMQFATIKQREDVARLGIDTKTKLFDSRLQFEQNERGRKFTNERQLADYVAATSADTNAFNAKMSKVQDMHKKKLYFMEAAQKQLEAALTRGYLKEKDDLDFHQQEKLATMFAKMKREIARAKSRAANNQAMWQAGGTIIGAVAGFTPVGIAMGGPTVTAPIGGAAGSMIGASQ